MLAKFEYALRTNGVAPGRAAPSFVSGFGELVDESMLERFGLDEPAHSTAGFVDVRLGDGRRSEVAARVVLAVAHAIHALPAAVVGLIRVETIAHRSAAMMVLKLVVADGWLHRIDGRQWLCRQIAKQLLDG